MFEKPSLNSPEFWQIAASLDKYDPKSVIPRVAALLTVPKLQANTFRLETLVHLTVAYCRGNESVTRTRIGKWLNKYLENSGIAGLEDPPEDVFVGNVGTSHGNRRIFNGTWPSNDYFAQVVVDILQDPEAPQEWRDLLLPISALLALSEWVAERLGLQRWHSEESVPQGTIELPSSTQLAERARAVTFSVEELRLLGIRRDMLEPFILHDNDKAGLTNESTADSFLERCPMIDLGGDLILALPHSVSPAIVRYVLTEMRKSGYLKAFNEALANLQARQLAMNGLGELTRLIEPLSRPKPKRTVPPLNDWLFRYDTDKCLHVALLHDRIDLSENERLSGFMVIREELRAALEEHLHETARHCRSLPGFQAGMTILVIGGFGRNYALGFKEVPTQWCFSTLPISDFANLAAEADGSTTRYLKCMWQKAWVEREGVRFMSINGDYDFYCCWMQQNYRLVPGEIPLSANSLIELPTDCALPVRQRVRNLTDSHVVETVDGLFVHSMRLHRGSYFKSLAKADRYTQAWIM